MGEQRVSFFARVADNRNQNSLATRARKKRFAFFQGLVQTVPGPVEILDIGGTQRFWERMGFSEDPTIHITLLNLVAPRTRYETFKGVAGDATDMAEFDDGEFDIVFSNSVIEHVGGHRQQRQMAQEVQRVGKRYFVQTPNFAFPIEPHFVFPAFHWLPVSMRIWLLRWFNLGWFKRTKDKDKAREWVESIHLLRKNELLALFPGAKLYEERILGLVKSFVVYHGW